MDLNYFLSGESSGYSSDLNHDIDEESSNQYKYYLKL